LMGIVSIILAFIGLGFLIFIHELGHYLMARRAGIRVETFSIGMGKPFYWFLHKGVRIQLGSIPFGGYVKMAGEKGGGEEDPDGLFAKSPWTRIKVAFWGPLANILFAFFAFSIIWATGGREKTFGETSSRVGWVDPSSELYVKGVRPGDRIVSYNGKPIRGMQDHFYAAMTLGPSVQVEVEKLHPTETPENLLIDVAPYSHPFSADKGLLTTGFLSPASFLIWTPPQGEQKLSIAAQESGIKPSDRLIWVDGEQIFSQVQLGSLLNDGCQLLTVVRSGKVLHVHIPRVLVGELRLPPEVRGEVSDWKYESGLHSDRLNQIWFIPYNINSEGVVETEIPMIDLEERTKGAVKSPLKDVLLPNDRIIAVGGERVSSAPQVLKALQEKRVTVVVHRGDNDVQGADSFEADALFSSPYSSDHLSALVRSIGTDQQIEKLGSFVLLKPIIPKTFSELFSEMGRTHEVVAAQEKEQEALEKIEDPKSRAAAEESLQLRDSQLFLGLFGVHDVSVFYNPSPVEMFWSVLNQMKQTICGLFGGYLSPRYMAGPVGIVHIMHKQLSVGYKEGLFWLGLISLNLAVLNLLPLPVLDGSHILLSFVEMVTGVRLRPELLEKIFIPFILLLIAFFIYITYHDLVRVFSNLFS